jgi:predicted nucleic acid-binding protein
VSLGLDTSVVLRLLTGQPATEARLARARVERAYAARERVLVTDLVLAEAYFALHYHYGIPKEEARSHLRRMANSGVVTVSPPEAGWALGESTGAGLADRLIHARHRSEGVVTLTFDKKMAALEGAVRLGRG